MTEKLDIIIPVWGEKELVPVLYNRLISVLKTMPVNYNIIYINDACPFNSIEELEKIAETDKNAQIISFSRNFGELAAVKAGIDNSSGDYAVIMDCDLQDAPEDIPKLYNKIKEGYDIVWGERVQRQDTALKKFLSNMFYFVNNALSEIKVNKKIGSFSIISKNVINELKNINSCTFNYIYSVKYLGFKEAYVPIAKNKREIGKSGYNIIKGTAYALKVIVFSSNKPLIIPVFSIFLVLIMFLILVSALCFRMPQDAFNALALLFIVIILGFICINISILALYTGIINKETADKPRYVIKSRKNFDN